MKSGSTRSMRIMGRSLFGLVAVFLMTQPVSAEVFTQIADPFAPVVYPVTGDEVGFSQFDPAADPLLGEEDNFATIYDNFSFASNVFATNFSWVGAYELPTTGMTPSPMANFFTVNVYTGVTATPGSGSLVDSFSVGLANETQIGATDYYTYSADIAPLSLTGGTEYFFSVVADLEFTDNGWGVAYSTAGESDGAAFQDIQEVAFGPIVRYAETTDFAFSVTAVPEPSSIFALTSLGLVAGNVVRRRRLRKVGSQKV